jgi:hypothetical protein
LPPQKEKEIFSSPAVGKKIDCAAITDVSLNYSADSIVAESPRDQTNEEYKLKSKELFDSISVFG